MATNVDYFIPIIAIIVCIVAIFIVYYFSYPFLLRFSLENEISTINPTNASNGANGTDGVNGQNGPQALNGVHGIAGKTTAHGPDGVDGGNGKAGNAGYNGYNGDDGGDGEDGSDGIPGYNVILVKENIFDTSSNPIHYVNGSDYDAHIINVSDLKDTHLTTEKTRLVNRIDNILRTPENKIYFTPKAEDLTLLIDPNGLLPSNDPEPIINGTFTITDPLGGVDSFNQFLDIAKSKITTNNADIKTVTDTQLAIIANKNEILKTKRATRDAAITAVDSDELTVRVNKILTVTNSVTAEIASINSSLVGETDPTKIAVLNAQKSQLTSFQLILTSLNGSLTVTFSSQIQILTDLLDPLHTTVNSTDSTVTVEDKKVASAKITVITNNINNLKSIKANIIHQLGVNKNVIMENYKTDVDIVTSKNAIVAAKLEISNNTDTLNQEFTTLIEKFKNAN